MRLLPDGEASKRIGNHYYCMLRTYTDILTIDIVYPRFHFSLMTHPHLFFYIQHELTLAKALSKNNEYYLKFQPGHSEPYVIKKQIGQTCIH